MKRLLTKLIVVILSLFCFLSPTPVFAKSSLQGYTIDIASLNTSLSKYITSLNFEEQLDGSFSLYINNSYVGSKSGDPSSFTYYPNSLTTIGISISASNQTISFSMSQKQEEIYNSAFVFTLDAEGNQSLTFYPSANSSSGVQTKTVKGSSGIFDFGTFSCTLGSTSVTFSVTLNSNNNTATITKNGSSTTYSVSKSTVTRTLYFENFVEGHPLDMNYMAKNLAKQTFANAKTIDYSDADVDAAVQNETLTLINSTTNKTYTVPLKRTITYWKRVSGGDWGTGEYGELGGEIQVVCEWHDAACSSIRSKYGESGRLFAVYGSSAIYPTITTYQYTKLEYPILYHNVRWDTSNWTTLDYRENSNSLPSGNYIYLQEQKRTKAWSDWSDWTDVVRPNGACSGGNCKGESAKFYRNRSYTWADITAWHLSDDCSSISSGSKSVYKTVQDPMCGTDYAECQHKDCGINQSYPYIYSNFGSYSTSKYGYQNGCAYRQGKNSECGTTYVRKSCSHQVSYSSNCNKCGTGQTCTTKNEGYTCKKVVSSWRSSSECNTRCTGAYGCSGVSCYGIGTCYHDVKTCSNYCKSCTLTEGYDCSYYETNSCTSYTCPNSRTDNYAYCHTAACGGAVNRMCTLYKCQSKSYGSWSDYIYKDSCPSTSNTECGDYKVKYRYSDIKLGDWSSWYTTSTFNNSGELVDYQHRYIVGVESWDTKKGDSSTFGTNVYYTGESKKSTTAQYVTDTYAKTSTVTIGSLAEMTAAQITAKTEEIAEALMLYNAYNAVKSDDGYTLYQDVLDYKNSNSKVASQAKEQALDYFERKTIFIPYMYITSHNRAVSSPGEISGYDNESLTSVTTSEVTKTATQGMKLIPYDIDLTKDTKIIYFDYRDPLINYKDELPENWQGYEEIIRELQHSDLTSYEIEIEMSASDLQAMKDYLKTHNYESNDCEMLREFSYIFKTTNSDLAKFLATGKGCKIEGD